MQNVEKAIKRLLEVNPFYAHFFLSSKVSYDKYDIPTAGAALTTKGVELVFNTKWLAPFSPEEVCAIVEHEILHVLFSHLENFGKKEEQEQKMLANVAMDCAINQYIKWPMPKDAVTLDQMKKVLKDPKLEALQTWQYYYEKMMQNPNVSKQMKGWDEHIDISIDKDGEIIDPKTGKPLDLSDQKKAALRSAIDKALKSAAGNAPDHVLKAFDGLSGKEAKLPWKQLLANWVAKRIDIEKRSSRKKMNRRFDLDQPGKVKKRTLSLGVCIDTSGSVSDEAFKAFMTEIMRISSMCSETYVVDADCVVQNIQKVNKTNYKRKLKTERHGFGGTAYQPAITACMKRKCDAIIYFGDMDAADKPVNPGVPFLWIIVGDNMNPPGDFGKTVKL